MLKTGAFFGGGNTEGGFVNYFPALTRATDRLYILKGGCGCGKNCLLKKVAAAAEEKGLLVERIRCASDPSSLDGVLLPEKGLGMVDGTPPHEQSPRLAGAMDNLVDLGEYWNSDGLRAHIHKVTSLTEEKKACYRRAYALLSARGALRRERQNLIAQGLLKHKLFSAAGRYADKLTKAKGIFKARLCPLYAFCGEGMVEAEVKGAEHWHLEDSYGISYIFLAAFANALKERGVPFAYSPHGVNTGELSAVLVDKAGIMVSKTTCTPSHIINMERFVDRSAISPNRQKLRFLTKTAAALKENARLALAEARAGHLALEEIYTPCMDFDRVNLRTKQLIKEMLA